MPGSIASTGAINKTRPLNLMILSSFDFCHPLQSYNHIVAHTYLVLYPMSCKALRSNLVVQS